MVGQRKALIRGLLCNLIKNKKIKTTEAKAKEIRPYIEKMITRAKRKDDLAGRRLTESDLNDKSAVKKIFDEIAPVYKDRRGGYTRIIKLPPREIDGARMAIIEFV